MKANRIDTKNGQIFLIVIFILFVNLFKYCMFCVMFLLPHVDSKIISYFSNYDVAPYFFNLVSYEVFNSMYMMSFYLINFRLNKFTEFIKKPRQNRFHILQTCSKFIDKVCETLESIKFSYTINTLTYIFHFCFFTTMSVYSIISLLCRKTWSEYDATFTYLTIAWNIIYSPFFIWVFAMSALMKISEKELENRIQDILNQNDQTLLILKKAEILNLQLYHQKPMNSCGLFVVDLHLLFSLASMFLSYLIIIIQFEWKTFND
jgi:hypothetical protein